MKFLTPSFVNPPFNNCRQIEDAYDRTLPGNADNNVLGTPWISACVKSDFFLHFDRAAFQAGWRYLVDTKGGGVRLQPQENSKTN